MQIIFSIALIISSTLFQNQSNIKINYLKTIKLNTNNTNSSLYYQYPCNYKYPDIIFLGTVDKIKRPCSLSGTTACYNSITYKIEKVVKGKYDKEYINIYYLIVLGTEIKDDLKVGDKQYVFASECSSSTGVAIIEKPNGETEIIKTLYVGCPQNKEPCNCNNDCIP